MIHLAIALLILVTDCEPSRFYYVRGELRLACMAQQIMDERERNYLFSIKDDFTADILLMRKRLAELYDAPLLHEADRFIATRDMANHLLVHNRQLKAQLLQLQDLYPGNPKFPDALAETELLYRVWDLFRDAKCEYYYVHIRRDALKKLRELLGEEDWRRSNLPPVIPIWR